MGTTVTTTSTATPATTTPASTPAKRTPAKARKVPPFAVLTLVVNAQQAQQAKALVAKRTAPGTAARAMGLSGGKYAMACYNAGCTPNGTALPQLHYGTPKGPGTPTALALAIGGKHNPATGYSWGKVAAMYRVTEGCARVAYTAGTGRPHNTCGVPGSAWAHRNAR